MIRRRVRILDDLDPIAQLSVRMSETNVYDEEWTGVIASTEIFSDEYQDAIIRKDIKRVMINPYFYADWEILHMKFEMTAHVANIQDELRKFMDAFLKGHPDMIKATLEASVAEMRIRTISIHRYGLSATRVCNPDVDDSDYYGYDGSYDYYRGYYIGFDGYNTKPKRRFSYDYNEERDAEVIIIDDFYEAREKCRRELEEFGE
ncbi:MAG: hypothetical protein Q4F60_03645 [Candidatus Saccharibacteria bacterium]|nr:hypothetical protein [Candidatus Saccharibacteria bacterium]